MTLFEKAGCIDELFSLLNRPSAKRFNYWDLDAICRAAMNLPPETCYTYPFSYLQIIFFMLLSGKRRPVAFAGTLLSMMEKRYGDGKTSDSDDPDHEEIRDEERVQDDGLTPGLRNIIAGELIVIDRVTGFGSFEGDDEPLERAAQLLGGRQSEILNPADPFTFGLPMLLHSEYMAPGTLDAAVQRCQYNAYELVSDGFGRGSEKLIRSEAALLRCQFDDAKRLAMQADADAAMKDQFFVMASARCVLMRRSLFLGDTEEAAAQLSDIRRLVPAAVRTIVTERISIAMLREVVVLAECFFATSLHLKDDIPPDCLDGSHQCGMVAGLGVPQTYMARAMYVTGDLAGAERMCDSLVRISDVCQCAQLYALMLSALCRERYYGNGSGMPQLKRAVVEAQRDGVMLPFAENPDVLPLLHKIERGDDISERFLQDVEAQCEAGRAVIPQHDISSIPKLSKREREVLRLTAIGKSRSEIAELLHVQDNTVKAQLSSAYRKLGAHGKTEAVRIAKTHSLI